MGQTFKNVCVVIVLIISLVLLLGSSFDLILKGFARQNFAVEINDENREYIESQLKYWVAVENKKEVPDMQDAVLISYLVSFDDYVFKVEFNDGRVYETIIGTHFPEKFMDFIKSEGYNCYFHSSEFLRDFVTFALCGTAVILCNVYLIRQIKRRKNKTRNGENIDVI